MNYSEIIYWLDGYLSDKNRDLTPEETKLINDKINSCFNKVTPNIYNPPTEIAGFPYHSGNWDTSFVSITC